MANSAGDIPTPKSIVLLQGFCMSFLFVAVYALAYLFTADLVAAHVAETGGFWQVWGPSLLISLVATLPCCATMFLFKTKRIVPMGFACLAVYYLLFLVAIARGGYTGPETAYLTHLVSMYMLPPVVLGNLLGWGSYLLWFRRREL